MNVSKKIILPLGLIAMVGACAPYPPEPAPPQPPAVPGQQDQTLTDKEQERLQESRRRIKEQERKNQERKEARRDNDSRDSGSSTTTVKPNKPHYPTASAVPGKDGFVFNPYTHNIVNVKGIAPGKLCRDPDDSDPTHKFRVP